MPDSVTLREITDANRDEVLALRVAPQQARFVGSVAAALADAEEVTGEGEPWPFYERLGFVATGKHDSAGEVILSLDLTRSG